MFKSYFPNISSLNSLDINYPPLSLLSLLAWPYGATSAMNLSVASTILSLFLKKYTVTKPE